MCPSPIANTHHFIDVNITINFLQPFYTDTLMIPWFTYENNFIFSANCPLTYIAYPDQKIPGLTLEPNMATADACKAKCTADQSCVGADYNTASSAEFACWIQKDITKTRVPQNTGEKVTHYEQKRSCGGRKSYWQQDSLDTYYHDFIVLNYVQHFIIIYLSNERLLLANIWLTSLEQWVVNFAYQIKSFISEIYIPNMRKLLRNLKLW